MITEPDKFQHAQPDPKSSKEVGDDTTSFQVSKIGGVRNLESNIDDGEWSHESELDHLKRI